MSYDRKVFSVIDVFAIIGGIYKSLTVVGFLFCAAFSYDLFISSLIRQLFHFKPRFPNEFQKKKDKNLPRKNSTGIMMESRTISQTEYIEKAIDKKMGVKDIKDEIREVTG